MSQQRRTTPRAKATLKRNDNQPNSESGSCDRKHKGGKVQHRRGMRWLAQLFNVARSILGSNVQRLDAKGAEVRRLMGLSVRGKRHGLSIHALRSSRRSTTRRLLMGEGLEGRQLLAVDLVSSIDPSLVSITGNGESAQVSVNADGTIVAFTSSASNLVNGDSNDRYDIFVKDLISGTITLVSSGANGLANDHSFEPSISADGTKVAFYSSANNLVSGGNNGAIQIYVKDLISGSITIVSSGANGLGNSWSQKPSISADGTKVAFISSASNLVSGDNNNTNDIFVKDLISGSTTLVNSGTNGLGSSISPSQQPRINADGTKVAFVSSASNLVSGDNNNTHDIFVKDLISGSMTLASSGANGLGNSSSFQPSISADGTKVAFYSNASNLVSGDNNNTSDIFVKDLITGSISIVSSGANGQGNSFSYQLSISADGTKVAFVSSASNLVSGDNNNTHDIFVKDLISGSMTLVSSGANGLGNYYSEWPNISADGTKVAFQSYASNLVNGDNNNFNRDIFVKDLVNGDLVLGSGEVPIPLLAAGGEGSSSTSADGTKVAFASSASNLATGDNINSSDIFVKDLISGSITLISSGANGLGNSDSYEPSISADGTKVAFRSNASNLVNGDNNNRYDIFVKDLISGSMTLVSSGANGLGNSDSGQPSISADATKVAFYSSASNLVSGDNNNTDDIFVKDLISGTITLVSSGANGLGNSFSQQPSISTNGTKVAFMSLASNLVNGDNNSTSDIFVKDLISGSVTLVSSGANGLGNSFSQHPSISADGTKVAFFSSASNLVSGDNNNTDDIFVKDLISGSITLVSSGANGLGNSGSFVPSISADGTKVAFVSSASNLVSGDNNNTDDIFVKDLISGSITLVSSSDNGLANAASNWPSISADGTQVVFASSASNLHPNDYNGRRDIYRVSLPSPPPTDIQLSNNSIQESDDASDSVVGTFSTSDESVVDSFTYTLVAGMGADDNDAFSILNNQLIANGYFDFETKSDYTIRVRSTDAGQLWTEKVFAINVLNVNEAPMIVNPLPDFSVLEDASQTVIDLAITFYDIDSLNLVLTATSSDPSVVAVSLNGTLLTLTYPSNANGSAIVTVTATDEGGLAVSDSFQVEVASVNDAPQLVQPLSDVVELENASDLAIDISSVFTDVEDEILALSVSSSNTTFVTTSIVGSQLILHFAPNRNGAAVITLTATDNGSLSVSDTFLVTVENQRPTLTMSGPLDGFLGVTGQSRVLQLTANDTIDNGVRPFTYEVLWGDGSPVESYFGPEIRDVNHTYATSGSRTVQARAIDPDGGVSDWTTIQLNIQTIEYQNATFAFGGTAGNDLFAVTTASIPPTMSISLNNVVLGTIAVPTGGIQFYGGAGSDTVLMNGTSDSDTFDVQNSAITWSGAALWPAPVTVQGFGTEKLRIQAHAGNDIIRILSGSAEVDGGTGSDQVRGPSTPTTWTFNAPNTVTLQSFAMTGVESILGGLAADTFAFVGNGSWSGSVDGSGGEDVLDYSGRSSAAAVNLITNKATSVGSMVSIERFIGSSSGTDTFQGPNTSNSWSVIGLSSSTLNNNFAISGFESLFGGSLIDTFNVDPAATSTPILNGGNGLDVLSYSNWSTPVSVNRQTRVATSVPSFNLIENFVGGSGSDSLLGSNTTTAWSLSGSNSGTFSGGTFSSFERLTGGSAVDTFTVSSLFAGEINGGSGVDTLIAANQSNSWSLTGLREGSLNGQVTFTGMENLTGSSQADTFSVASTASGFGTIQGGIGADQLSYSTWSVPISVGRSAAPGLTSFAGIETLLGTSSSDTVAGSNLASTWTITGQDLITSSGIVYSSFENLQGGSLADVITLSTPSSRLSGSIRGGDGSDTLRSFNGTNLWSLTGNRSGTLIGTQNFSEIESLTGGTGTDTFQFLPGSGGFGIISGGTGADTLDYSSLTTSINVNLATSSASLLASFGSIENFVGSSASDTFTGTNTNSAWTVNPVSGNRVGTTTFSSFESIQGGTGSDEFALQAIGAIQVRGGAGIDTVIGRSSDSDWNINGVGAGSIQSLLQFSEMENLTGGLGSDLIRIEPTGSVPGTLNGGDGVNTLSYATWTTSVVVNATEGTATAIQSLAANFQIIMGGSGSDNLSAFNSIATVLVGNSGNDILTGGALRDILFGSGNADQLTSNGDEDILSGGRTAYDNNVTALKAIRAEWLSSRTYQQRIGNLRGTSLTGTPLNANYFLTNSPTDTLLGDSSIDTSTGGSETDWFIKSIDDALTDWSAGEEIDDPNA